MRVNMASNCAMKNGFDEDSIFENLNDKDFDDPEGFVDEIDSAELKEIIHAKEPTMENYMECILIVDHIPVTDTSRLEKLRSALNNLFTKLGLSVKCFEIPNDGVMTKGFMLLWADNVLEAGKIQRSLSNLRFDKNHIFQCYTLEDKQKIESSGGSPSLTPDSMTCREFVDIPGIYSWLVTDEDCNHFATSDNKGTVSICTFNPFKVMYTYEQFSQIKIQWSPKGTFLVAFHKKGIMISTVSSPEMVNRKFQHPDVSHCGFSPCEKFLLTYSISHNEQKQKMNLFVWDVLTGTMIKKLVSEPRSWPIFKWSYDGSYLADVIDENLIIYETKNFTMVGNGPHKIPNIQDISWSLTANELVYWEKRQGDIPSHIILLKVPALEKIKTRQIFNLEKCEMYWNDNGSLLAISLERSIKKTMSYAVEIIGMESKLISMDRIDLKSPVTNFSWEPNSSICIIMCPPFVSIYRVTSKSATELKTFETYNFDTAFWSPYGRIVVVASIKSMQFEIWDTHELVLLGKGMHPDANHLSWDPTGRYFFTYASGSSSSDGKIIFWSCAGYIVLSHNVEGLSVCLWRPRPKTLVSPAVVQEIKDNPDLYVKKYSQKIKLLQNYQNKDNDLKDLQAVNTIFGLQEDRKTLSELHEYFQKCVQAKGAPSIERTILSQKDFPIDILG